MAVERLADNINAAVLDHCVVLYGLGIFDDFASQKYLLQNFKQALFDYLSENGFERIIFYAPNKGLTFLDQNSKDRSKLSKDRQTTNTPGLCGCPPNYGGPLKRPLQVKTSPSSPSNSPLEDLPPAMTDERAVSHLDAFMKNNDCRTAVVIMQPDETLKYLDCLRLLSSFVNGWMTDLPSGNDNTCFWLFNRTDLDDIFKTINITIPACSVLFSCKPDKTQCGVVNIPGPDKNELYRLLNIMRLKGELSYNYKEAGKLLDWLAAENKMLKTWRKNFKDTRLFDIKTVRKKNWLPSMYSEIPALDRLKSMTGLEVVKKKVDELMAVAKDYKQQIEQGLPVDPQTLHLVFQGPPGVGKSTVAKLIGEIYHDLGFLNLGHFVEIKSPSELTTDHVGGTGKKTREFVNRALDGVLFIDEAHGLADDHVNSFFAEARAVLSTSAENYRDRLVIILAGYANVIDCLNQKDPGFNGRFPDIIDFPSYEPDELFVILQTILNEKRLTLTDAMAELLKKVVTRLHAEKNKNFSNGRTMRNFADALYRRWSVRRQNSHKPFDTPLEENDLPEEYKKYSTNGAVGQNEGGFDAGMAELEFDEVMAEMESKLGKRTL
jgi:DNA polymerase III delta prime subunit